MTVDVPGLTAAAGGVGSSHDRLTDPNRHGDADAGPGLVDFAVNVRPGPPPFIVEALTSRIADLAAYPSDADTAAATARAAAIHGRDVNDVLLLGGAAEGFELVARLGFSHAALIQPSFTEPERVLVAAGTRVTHVTPPPPWRLSDAEVPEDADLVVVGNPTNPTSVLHPAADLLALRRPGRTILVDEAFADLTLDGDRLEPESVAHLAGDDLIVVRSVTKTFGLAGLRAGYLLASSQMIDAMTRGRRHWPLGTLTLTALHACLGAAGQGYAHDQARIVAADRAHLVARLGEIGLHPLAPPRAPYVLLSTPHALDLKETLRERGFAVRSCANFVGLGSDHLRLAVRPKNLSDALIAAMQDMRDQPAEPGETGNR
ncbi:threonine-phosphate decarboxylase [Gordonia sp. PDNC005]|uniref:Rv2231c family pyridoxal phosphate-dependent protein CobC n=1 Tax=Gordonia sp. PDNC005 TaxID=2811424 RepID=UPI001965ACAB|nr:Rv2231c family pyridoxal phosphate-dependent protein CobC [Gordonia sp. PDNC005]QRY60935.1 threonine-phosphate decarboxylase [Gordonia sp. PDNC005]